nr:ATP synthase F(0) complex subunit B1, mitochondrial isoform X2 [Loxodonta africana]
MLSRVVLSAAATAASSLKNAAFIGPGVIQATRIFHTGQPSLAPVPPLPEYGGKVRFGLIPEEFFQLLYPKTGVTGPYVLGTGLILYFLSKEIYVITSETVSGAALAVLVIYAVKKYGAFIGQFADKLSENNIAMAFEVAYRERLHTVYREVKNRLDYHISVQNMMRRKEQEHMINWLEKKVVQSISAQQEKETIAKCIEDLKLLAKKAQAQPVM